ncbi:MAG: glycerol-3-phosphate 1-O-acyltransferase PlsY [Planctomyces sp.]|jgi:glycerol-3-phosphate acyltransferase PlsY
MTSVFLISVVAAFLIGGIPFGYLIARAVLNDDIRNHGSGNTGATNVWRVLGWRWGVLVLILDALKGMVPVAVVSASRSSVLRSGEAFSFLKPFYSVIDKSPELAGHLVVATGVAAIVGHMLPVYLRFRGGKGVATALGVVLVMAPMPSLGSVVVFALIFGFSRIVAAGSIAASLAFCVIQLGMLGDRAFTKPALSLTAFSILIPALIIWRHRSNIVRIWRGQEKPLVSGRSQSNGT